jgi:hypothetical protein
MAQTTTFEVVVFDHDQPVYDHWSTQHPQGYVAALCTHHPPQTGHFGLHRANCSTIAQQRASFDYTASPKVCRSSQADIQAWLMTDVRQRDHTGSLETEF